MPGPRDFRKISDSHLKKILKDELGTDPHSFKAEYVGKNDVAKFDVHSGPGGELYLISKDGRTRIPTGVFPGRGGQ